MTNAFLAIIGCATTMVGLAVLKVHLPTSVGLIVSGTVLAASGLALEFLDMRRNTR